MKRITVMKIMISLLILIIVLTGCSSKTIEIGVHKVTKANSEMHGALNSFPEAPDGDITKIDFGSYDVSEIYFDFEELLYKIRFNTKTIWPEVLPEKFDPNKIIELGKDPGLHVRDLHAQGVDGRGISIGIVDETLFTGHNEYKDNLVHYEDISKSDKEWDMHGTGVASLAVGKTTGVAPGAKLYFIEASWDDEKGKKGDMTYRHYAEGIHRLLDINKQLPEHEKIKVISISANPNPDDGVNDYEDYQEALKRAKDEGVFIIAASSDVDYGFRFGGLGRIPLFNPNNINYYYGTDYDKWKDEGRVFFPMGSRTFASYIGEDDYSWIRPGEEGWMVPYIAGLYAMSLQVNPNVTPDLFWKAVEETADIKMDSIYRKNIRIANPVKLISKLAGKSYSIITSELSKSQDVILKPYDDIHSMFYPNSSGNVFEKCQYKPVDIYTYTFDNTTVFKCSEDLATKILEEGKNPGLGIRDLHKQGITGKNVNVAIIDQNMLTDHPEFEGRIVKYYDSGCNTPENEGSYHGASVTSILAGKTIGVAPEVNVFYAAAPSWERDAKYKADCLNWVIEQNKALPKSEKIRIVSVSSSPSTDNGWKNGELWEKAVLEAQKEGIMVIDCYTGFVFSSYYDLDDKENVSKCIPGYPNDDKYYFTDENWKNILFAPASFRTLAQEFIKGEYRYRYDSVGGRSWAVPYVSGVLALGWQVNPQLDGETMKELLFETSWVNEEGLHFINPPAFIEAVQN